MSINSSMTMIEKNGTGVDMRGQGSNAVEKSGTGIARRRLVGSLIEKNGTGIRALSSGVMLAVAMGLSASAIAEQGREGYVLLENEQATLSINNDRFSSSGQLTIQSGYGVVPLKIIDAKHLDLRFAALRPLSEGSGTGWAGSEGSGTGRPGSEGSGTGRPESEGSGTGRPESEGSGTGRIDSEGSGTGRVSSEGSGTGKPTSEGSGTGVTSEGSGTGRTSSEGSGTGWTSSEGSGTGSPSSEGSGTGSPSSEGSGTGRVGSEGSGTGQPTAFAVDVCVSNGRMGSASCDAGDEFNRRSVIDGFAEIVIDGQSAFVLVYEMSNDGSIVELAALELPVIHQ